MSKYGQKSRLGPELQFFPRGGVIAEHWRDEDQLVVVEQGAATVREEGGTWIATPGRALFFTSRLPHAVKLSAGARVRAVAVGGKGRRGAVLAVRVSPLLRELVAAAASRTGKIRAAFDVLLRDEIERASEVALFVPEAKHQRLAEFCRDWRKIQGRPGVKNSVPGRRTVDRMFRAEMGIGFREWRERIQLMRALELLGEGREVRDVAEKLGFASASSFVFSFRRVLGAPPALYFRDLPP